MKFDVDLFLPNTDFTCAVESTVLLHGRMFLTSKFLCFYSNLFGLEKKIRIPWSHITSINKENTALVIPNAISVTTCTFNNVCCSGLLFLVLYFVCLCSSTQGIYFSIVLG